MPMGKTQKNQLFSSLLFLGVLFPSLCFVCFLGFGFSSFLVSLPIMIISTIFLLKFTNKKRILDKNPAENLISSQDFQLEKEGLNQVVETEKQGENELKPILETIQENETAQHSENGTFLQDTTSESEASDDSQPSESFELKWMSSTNVGQNLPIFEYSLPEEEEDSDEDDNLIEISLPGSEPSRLKEANMSDFLPESIFRQHGLMELLADINEMNEEENLIEIDISMGSIKCPRFEIEA